MWTVCGVFVLRALAPWWAGLVLTSFGRVQIWDSTAKGLGREEIDKSSYAVIGIASVVTVGIAFINL